MRSYSLSRAQSKRRQTGVDLYRELNFKQNAIQQIGGTIQELEAQQEKLFAKKKRVMRTYISSVQPLQEQRALVKNRIKRCNTQSQNFSGESNFKDLVELHDKFKHTLTSLSTRTLNILKKKESSSTSITISKYNETLRLQEQARRQFEEKIKYIKTEGHWSEYEQLKQTQFKITKFNKFYRKVNLQLEQQYFQLKEQLQQKEERNNQFFLSQKQFTCDSPIKEAQQDPVIKNLKARISQSQNEINKIMKKQQLQQKRYTFIKNLLLQCHQDIQSIAQDLNPIRGRISRLEKQDWRQAKQATLGRQTVLEYIINSIS